jgi:mandelate racemase
MQEKLTLRSVETTAVLLPLRRPLVSKVGRYEHWPLILIDLHTEEGIVGRSYLEPYLQRSVRYIMPAIHDLAAARRGQRIAPLDDWRRDRTALNLIGYAGVSMIAVAGLDMAAWDALAKAAGLPLAVYLGGSLGQVPAYNSNGLWLTPIETLAQEAAELVAEGGFKALKLRLGRERASEDIEAITSIRRAVGDDVKLMVDFNQGRTFGDALERCHALDDQALYWLEEPIAYDNLAGYADLRRKLKTPIQLGENFYGPRDLYQAIAAGAADYVMPDLMRIGGVTGWLRSAPIAAAAGIQVSTHLYPEVSAHLMRVTETAHWLEWQDWVDPILAQPYRLERGTLTIPDRPGCGIEWNEEAVRKYRMDGAY